MSTLMEQTSEKEIKQQQNIHTDEELEIDLMDLLRKVIGCLLYTSVNLRVGRYEEAIQILNNILKADPKYAEAYRFICLLQLYLEQPQHH